jgi:hypothetical protein
MVGVSQWLLILHDEIQHELGNLFMLLGQAYGSNNITFLGTPPVPNKN